MMAVQPTLLKVHDKHKTNASKKIIYKKNINIQEINLGNPFNKNVGSEGVFLHLTVAVAASASPFVEAVGSDGRKHRRRGRHSCRP